MDLLNGSKTMPGLASLFGAVQCGLLFVIGKFAAEEVGLGACIAEVAREQKEVSRLDAPGETHKETRVEEECSRHPFGDHLRRLVGVKDAGQDQAPVGGGSPEVDCLGSNRRVHKRLESICHFKSQSVIKTNPIGF